MSKTPTSQTQAFLEEGEGDRYFRRNRAKLTGGRSTEDIAFYLGHLPTGGRVLEIGCANGNVLDHFCRAKACEGWGLDPSAEAIADGRARFPALRLERGAAHDLPFADGFFDAVLFGFCLYLVDRAFLPRVVAEADRVLKDGGKLMITDFDMPWPARRCYAHAPGLSTYKMNYAALFTAFPQYVEIAKFPFAMRGDGWQADPQERVAAWVLGKEMTHAYFDAEPEEAP